jgi:hypothetical protein
MAACKIAYLAHVLLQQDPDQLTEVNAVARGESSTAEIWQLNAHRVSEIAGGNHAVSYSAGS